MSHVDYKINILHIDFSITVYIIDSLTAVGPQTWLRCAYKRWGGPLGALSLIIVMNMSVIFFFSFLSFCTCLATAVAWDYILTATKEKPATFECVSFFSCFNSKIPPVPDRCWARAFFSLLFTCSYLGVIATKASFFFSWLQLPPSQPSLFPCKNVCKMRRIYQRGLLGKEKYAHP